MFKIATALVFCCLTVSFSGCSSSPPSNPDDLCAIFQEKDSWYVAAHRVHERHKVPINVAMAILSVTLAGNDDEDRPMRWFLFIPYGRGDLSFGHVQAPDEIWNEYVDSYGSMFTERENFADALDFVGWYMTRTKAVNGIALTDAYNQFLNYIEGWDGFAKGSYEDKEWLKNMAQDVAETADNYRDQLLKCNLY